MKRAARLNIYCGLILLAAVILVAVFVVFIISSGNSDAPDTDISDSVSVQSDTSTNEQGLTISDGEEEMSGGGQPGAVGGNQTDASPTQSEKIDDIYPDVIGIYLPADNGSAARKLISGFSSSRVAGTDIDCFEVIASQEELLEGESFSSIWKDAWTSYKDTENSKIGFHIEFSISDGTEISKTLLKPSDADEFFEYIEVYMYDDINQTPGVWYTHLSDVDIDDETIISSIKLTSGAEVTEVGDIYLTCFVYNGLNNFDKDGNYIGVSSYKITIARD